MKTTMMQALCAAFALSGLLFTTGTEARAAGAEDDPRLHAPALQALQRDSEVKSCMDSDPAAFRKSLDVEHLDAAGSFVLVHVGAACLCGNVNCPFWIFRVHGMDWVQVAGSYGFATNVKPLATSAYPEVVSTAHDSAAVSIEERYGYRGGTYALLESARVRADTGERKPDALPVRFAAGASSAVLRGTTATGFEDAYSFAAAKGQVLTISEVQGSGVAAVLFLPGSGTIDVQRGKSVRLPTTGRYRLQITTSSDANTRYVLRLAIR